VLYFQYNSINIIVDMFRYAASVCIKLNRKPEAERNGHMYSTNQQNETVICTVQITMLHKQHLKIILVHCTSNRNHHKDAYNAFIYK